MSLRINILFIFLLTGLGLSAQSFFYQYVDPCTKEIKTINADMSAPIIIAYYGQTRAFTYDELSSGYLEVWMNDIYLKYRNASPCQGAVITTTTTSNSNQVYGVMNSVMSITSIDFSSISNMGSNMSGVGMGVGQNTNSGTAGVGSKEKGKNEDKDKPGSGDAQVGSNSGNGGASGDNSGGSTNGSGGSGSGGNQQGSSSGSGAKSGSSGSGGEGEVPEEKIDETPGETVGEGTGTSVGNSTSKAKSEVRKPAILLTGDIVGVQTTENGAQDARGTVSYTRVKGDGSASIGISADYMVNARIGNVSAVKSWISTNSKGHKRINLVNAGINYLPRSWSTTGMFIRVNSLKKFTAIYGVAGSYGSLFEEEIISTMAIAGFMYKGKLTKNLDATIIAAGIYSPYSKYYTESILESSPVVIPFLNLTYRLTKTFGFGLTGGGTYIAGQDVINYQVLLGAKIIL